MEIKLKVSLVGGQHISLANMDSIVAKSIFPTSSISTKVIDGIIAEKGEYYPEWRVKKEPKGYIFREVNSDCGICGHHPSLRKLIIASIGHRIKIEIENV